MSEDIEEEVLRVLKPSLVQIKLLNNFYRLIKDRMVRCLTRRGLNAIVEPEGSFAKNTLLSDKWELDIFVLFKDVDESWILNNAEILLRECLEGLPISIRYAQHPYVTVHLMGMQADVVPAKFIKKPTGKLGVERTPFHTRYVRKKIRENPRIADEIRLLKSFLKGIGAYGAESSIGGFSGYLAELLVIYYGSFRRTLEEVSNWKPGIFIDIENIGNEDFLKRKYKDSVLIVVDPVDPERNVAASVTLEKFSTFILSARTYLNKPCKNYFHIYSHKREYSSRRGLFKDVLSRTIIVYLEGDYERLPRDSLLGKLKRLATYITRELRLYNFNVIRYKFYTDEVTKAAIVFELESLIKPKTELLKGPYSWDALERTLKFLRKRISEKGYVWVNDEGMLIGVRERRFTKATDLVAYVLASAPLLKFTKRIRVLAGEEARGWLSLILKNFILEVPAWMSCL